MILSWGWPSRGGDSGDREESRGRAGADGGEGWPEVDVAMRAEVVFDVRVAVVMEERMLRRVQRTQLLAKSIPASTALERR